MASNGSPRILFDISTQQFKNNLNDFMKDMPTISLDKETVK